MILWFVTMLLYSKTTVGLICRYLLPIAIQSAYVTPTDQSMMQRSESVRNSTAVSNNNHNMSGTVTTDFSDTVAQGRTTMSGHPTPIGGTVTGVYDYGRSTNFEAYLQELGVSYILRRLAGLASPTVTITRNQQTPCQVEEGSSVTQPCPKEWTVRTTTLFKSHEVSFNLGEPVNDTTMDGRNVEMTVKDTTPSGGDPQGTPPVWTETQVSLDWNFNRLSPQDGGKTTQLIRTFLADKMTVDLSCGQVQASSVFHRRPSIDSNSDLV